MGGIAETNIGVYQRSSDSAMREETRAETKSTRAPNTDKYADLPIRFNLENKKGVLLRTRKGVPIVIHFLRDLSGSFLVEAFKSAHEITEPPWLCPTTQ